MSKKNNIHYGIAVNDANYRTQIIEFNPITGKREMIWKCPYYVRWRGMLFRCYSEHFQQKGSAYKGVMVCDEWLRFSNFKRWMEAQDWQGKELDKDLLVEDNKVYSPNTCCFITQQVNLFISEKIKEQKQPANWGNEKEEQKPLYCSDEY